MNNRRYIMEVSLSDITFTPQFKFKQINESDFELLGKLLYEADLGTVDDEGLPIENSIDEIRDTLSGKYGKFLNECSFTALDGEIPVAAVLLTFYDKESLPLIAFTMTHPKFKNQGLCKGLLQLSLRHLNKAGYKKCFLAVNAANLPAIAVYKKVGFQIRQQAV
jgi:predicted N-acetyltransferase YhbS